MDETICQQVLEQLYEQYSANTQKLAADSVMDLQEFLSVGGSTKNIESQDNQENYDKPSDDAPKTTQGDEKKKETPSSG